jgi:hypothetical protein
MAEHVAACASHLKAAIDELRRSRHYWQTQAFEARRDKYTLMLPYSELVRLYRITEGSHIPNLPPRWNVAPNQEIPAVRLDRDGKRRLVDYQRPRGNRRYRTGIPRSISQPAVPHSRRWVL